MIRTAACFVLAFAALAGTADAAKAPAKPVKATPATAPERAPDILQDAIRVGRAIPNRAGLTLVLAGGRHITMTDDTRGCPLEGDQTLDDGHCYRYVLLRDLPGQHAFIVGEAYYEGQTLLLIDDRSGRQTNIDGVPEFSPDGQRFFVNDDDEASDHDNNLEVWRRDGDGAVLEWAHPCKQVYVEAPVLKGLYHAHVMDWSAKNDIALAFTQGDRSWNGHLTRGIKGWELAADWPAK